MAGRIIWNGNTLSLPKKARVVYEINEDRNIDFSASRKHQVIHWAEWTRVTISLRLLTKAEMFPFWSWWAWARLGNEFTFSLDNQDTESSITVAAAAAQANITVNALGDISADDWIKVFEVSGDDYEAIKVQSVGGLVITCDSNLLNAYAVGDKVRNIDYFPIMIVDMDMLPLPTDAPGYYFSFDIIISEVS